MKKTGTNHPGFFVPNIAALSVLAKNYLQAIEFANKALAINGNSKKVLLCWQILTRPWGILMKRGSIG